MFGPDPDPRPLALLLLADGRFPAGGHAHSAGVESAVADGRVTGIASLEAFVAGRLATTGLTEAALAAATVLRLAAAAPRGTAIGVAEVELLDEEADARIPAPPLREASQRLGRQLVRAAQRCWPSPRLDAVAAARPQGAHLPVALGAVGASLGLGPAAVAQLAVHHVASTATTAAVRLLGLDPFEAAAVVARAGEAAATVVATAVDVAAGPLHELPARGSPLVDVAAVEHRGWDVRMFAT